LSLKAITFGIHKNLSSNATNLIIDSGYLIMKMSGVIGEVSR